MTSRYRLGASGRLVLRAEYDRGSVDWREAPRPFGACAMLGIKYPPSSQPPIRCSNGAALVIFRESAPDL